MTCLLYALGYLIAGFVLGSFVGRCIKAGQDDPTLHVDQYREERAARLRELQIVHREHRREDR